MIIRARELLGMPMKFGYLTYMKMWPDKSQSRKTVPFIGVEPLGEESVVIKISRDYAIVLPHTQRISVEGRYSVKGIAEMSDIAYGKLFPKEYHHAYE